MCYVLKPTVTSKFSPPRFADQPKPAHPRTTPLPPKNQRRSAVDPPTPRPGVANASPLR